MAYSKTNWVDRSVQYPNRFTQSINGSLVTLTPSPGTITQAGTPITAANLNKIEDGIAVIDQSLALYAKKQQEAFINAVLQNGWVTESSLSSPARYYKDETGRVHLTGFVYHNAPVVWNAVLFLPVGYRPAKSKFFVCYTGNGDTVHREQPVQVFPDGGIVIHGVTSSNYLSLDGISFRAEQ